MDSQNKELKERVKELEIKLKKANRENSKLKKKQKKIMEDDLTSYIASLQSKTEEQAEEIERLLTEKETLPNHSESQTRNTRKKTEILEQILDTHVQLLENKHKPTTIVNTRPPTNTLPISNPSTTVLDEEIIRLKLEILFAKRSFEEEKLCVVCQDAEKVMAFVPCGHKCACEICSIGLSACPLCRIPCEFKCRIYQ